MECWLVTCFCLGSIDSTDVVYPGGGRMDYVNYSEISGSDLETLLFRSDILAPHEYWKVHRPDRFRQPELELMMAVLEDALHCFFTNVQVRTRREKKIFAETEEWFFTAENEGVFTFENICSQIG